MKVVLVLIADAFVMHLIPISKKLNRSISVMMTFDEQYIVTVNVETGNITLN